ncbi:hypothetical protein, partial [Cupriavidus taiwanensis]|uniref:hypothetical protein n=1 Tax=Cupriavidus taiwanensis TaxID=164546 RepID=UPI001E55912C
AALFAAEKRDYAELSSFRQPFAAIFFTAAGAANCAAPTFRSTPQPLLRLPCRGHVVLRGGE